MIQISLKNTNSKAANGMRFWIDYVKHEVSSKLSGVECLGTEGSLTRYRSGDSVSHFSMAVDADDLVITLTLTTHRADGSESSAAPIPALVILMVILHLVRGRAQAGGMVALKAKIGTRTYSGSREDSIEAYAALKRMMPEAWYLPYTEGVKDPAEALTRR